MVYDSTRSHIVLFGGDNGQSIFGDTWEWDGNDWSNHTSLAGSPPARTQHGMAYDSAHRQVVIFGGYGSDFLSDTWQYPGCGVFVDKSVYGRLLFPPFCTRDASVLPNNVYNSILFSMSRGANDRLFLSSVGGTQTGAGLGLSFSPLVVDDAIYINGVDVHPGPYSPEPGVPPFVLNVPIEWNFVALPPFELPISMIPTGKSEVTVELLDPDRTVNGNVYGNTAVYLVRDCGIWLGVNNPIPGNNPISINWITYDDQVGTLQAPVFDIRRGLISQLRADQNFSKAICLGRFTDTPATVMPADDPATGDGYYFVAKGISSVNCNSYGDSTLDTLPACGP